MSSTTSMSAILHHMCYSKSLDYYSCHAQNCESGSLKRLPTHTKPLTYFIGLAGCYLPSKSSGVFAHSPKVASPTCTSYMPCVS